MSMDPQTPSDAEPILCLDQYALLVAVSRILAESGRRRRLDPPETFREERRPAAAA